MSRFHADESAALAPINRENGYVHWRYFLSVFWERQNKAESCLSKAVSAVPQSVRNTMCD